MEEKILRELGFSEREIKVYLALLETGQTTVGKILKKTKLQHSKVYQTLNKLIDRGLVSFVIKSKTKYFQAQSPKRILNILKEKENKFSEVLPRLLLKQKLSQEQQIATVYEGQKAVKTMFNNILDELDQKSTYYIFALKKEYKSSPEALRFLRNLHLNLSEKKSDNRLIVHNSVKRQFLKNSGDIKNIKHKFTRQNLPPGLMIINDKVINWAWGERPTAVEITSKLIAEQYKSFFLEVWNSI